MKVFEEKAEQIHSDMNGGIVAVDPVTLTLIIKLLVEVIEMYRNCNKSEEKALTSMQSPNFIDRWRFRRLARKRVGDMADGVVTSSYKISKNLTLSDVNEMYATVPAIYYDK